MKLSICIATFNRAAFIGETLTSIAVQTTDDVEIVVLDGGSNDSTGDIVSGLQKSIPRLRYVRQSANQGVDRDFDAAVKEATGEYCWLMSDDDLLKPGAVNAVLSAISRHHSLIIVNSEVRNFDLTKVLDPDRLRFGENRVYPAKEFQRLFEETSGYLTYIGAVVIRRELWLRRAREPYFGSFFIHVGVIFQAPLPDSTLVLAEPFIAIRFGNAQWRPKEFEIRMIRWTELIWSLPGITEATRSRCYRREPWKSVKSLLFYRAKGTYSLNDYRRWVLPRATAPWDRAKALAVALIPGVIANLIGLVYCSFDYRDSKIHLLDMRASPYYYRNLVRARWLRS